jgi:hypothetical protein
MTSSVLARGRARALGALTLLATALVLSAGAGQAHAAGATIWPYANSFVPGDVGRTYQIAANRETGNVLVLDSEDAQRGIVQMDESGNPVPFTDPALAGAAAIRSADVPGQLETIDNFSDIAVDNTGTATQGNIYIVSPKYDAGWQHRLLGFKASGELLFDVTRPGRGNGLGIAPDGDIWVGLGEGSGAEGRMEEFSPAGTPTGSAFVVPPDIVGNDVPAESELDAAGNMYILMRGTSRVVRRSPSGIYRVLSLQTYGLAFDSATGNVLTVSRGDDNSMEIRQYGPDGELEEVSGIGVLPYHSLVSLALGADDRTLFYSAFDIVAYQTTFYVFGPAVRRPEADAASGVGTTSASLAGVVRPGGAATTYQFEYGTTKSLGSVAPSAPVDAGSGTGPVAASASLSGLKPQTFYYYRLKATVGGQTAYGKVRTMRTAGPAVVAGAVSGVGPSSVTLGGTVDVFDLGAASFHVLVEGVGSPFSAASAELPVPAGSGPQPVSAPVSGLRPGQRYTLRLVASAGGATAASAPVSFQAPELGAVAPVPPPSPNPSPYGCVMPAIIAPTGSVRAGDVVTLSGSDLGVGGTVLVGGAQATVSRWSASSVAFELPEASAGKVPVSVSCGKASNSVELSVTAAPSNVFRLGVGTVKGSSGAVAVALPGAGTVVTTGKYLSKSTVKVKQAGRASVQLRLTAAGKRALAKARSGSLKVTAQVRYTPAGGSGRTLSKSVTFKRGGSR